MPIDYSDLTLISLTPGVGFLEQSNMGSMKIWLHERPVEVESTLNPALTRTF